MLKATTSVHSPRGEALIPLKETRKFPQSCLLTCVSIDIDLAGLGLSTDNAELFIENPEAAKEVAQKAAETTPETCRVSQRLWELYGPKNAPDKRLIVQIL